MTTAAAAPISFERATLPPEWLRACAAFAMLTGMFTAVFFGSIETMATIWMSSSAYHHGMVVAPISAWLIFSRKDWRAASPKPDYLGVAALAVASLAQLAGIAAGVDLIGHASYVVAIIGAAIAVFGRAIAARWAFPLAFLFFMVPFGEELTPALQGWASAAIAAALNFSGLETAREGFMLTTSAGRFEVAASCAGLRFLLASAMISSLVSYLAFAGWRKRATFIALALAAAVFANWLRAYLIILFATFTDRRLGVGPEHVMLGWIFYSALILGMILIARRHADKSRYSSDGAQLAAQPRRTAAAAIPLGVTVIAAAWIYQAAALSMNDLQIGNNPAPSLHDNRFKDAGATSTWESYAPNADAISTRDYHTANARLTVSLVYFTHDREGAEIGGAMTRAADGVKWRRTAVAVDMMTISGARRRVAVESLENAAGRKIEVATLYWLGDNSFGSLAALKFDIAARKLTGRPTGGGVMFVAAGEDENADPRASIRQYFESMEPVGVWRSTLIDRE